MPTELPSVAGLTKTGKRNFLRMALRTLLRDVSQNGHLVDWLMDITSVFNIILFTIMCVWMGWACFKHNRHHPAEYDHGNSKHSVTIALAISAFIFAIVDGNLFVNSINDLDKEYWNFEKVAANPKTLRLEINAHQWAWDARYAGPDGKFNTEDDIVTWNEIKVPVGVPIYVELTSTDVIHSFYLPNFRTKMDAGPTGHFPGDPWARFERNWRWRP